MMMIVVNDHFYFLYGNRARLSILQNQRENDKKQVIQRMRMRKSKSFQTKQPLMQPLMGKKMNSLL